MKPLRTRQAGLSLVEVLAGVAIFSVVAAGLASSTVSTIRANAISRDAAAASALVQDTIEKYRAYDPVGNAGFFGPGDYSDANNPVTATGEAGGMFTRTWTIATDTPRQGLAQIVVTVSWKSPQQQRKVQGVAYVCRTATCS